VASAKPHSSRLRIIGGELRSRMIHFHERPELRPTLGRVREAVFNALRKDAATHGFIDLCAGSGAMGFEAWSRGFRPTLLAETDAASARELRANARALAVDAQIYQGPAQKLATLGLPAGPWVLYADPPFSDAGFHEEMMTLAAGWPFVEPGSLYLAETERAPAPLVPGFVLIKAKRYGRAHIAFFEKLPSRPGT